jgi:hypothetical protein
MTGVYETIYTFYDHLADVRQLEKLSGTLTRSEIRHLNSTQKEQYAGNLIYEVLRKNRGGLAISSIEMLTHLNRNTIERHLARLSAIQVVEKEVFGITAKYKLAQRSQTGSEMEFDTGSDVFYSLQVMNRDGERVLYVQQKELNELRGVVVKGGITVKFGDFEKFLEQLKLYFIAQRSAKPVE